MSSHLGKEEGFRELSVEASVFYLELVSGHSLDRWKRMSASGRKAAREDGG